MAGSKSAALPLGYAPTASAGGESKQPGDCAEALELVAFAHIKALLCRRRSSYNLAATHAGTGGGPIAEPRNCISRRRSKSSLNTPLFASPVGSTITAPVDPP